MLESGFELLEGFLSPSQIDQIIENVSSYALEVNAGGVRNAEKKFASIKSLAKSQVVLATARSYLKGNPALVRAILFDKTQSSNWLVTWHQDRTVAVSKKFDLPGWGPWSIKDGVVHVQPPAEILEDMVTFRIHLDHANGDNGCLKVIPHSHVMGMLDSRRISSLVRNSLPVTCNVKAGSTLVMRPLLLHASSKVTRPSHRRIIHLEFSSYMLPLGISWA